MGAQNSRSSFKNNSSINANDPNAMASEYFSIYVDSFLLITPRTNPLIKMWIF